MRRLVTVVPRTTYPMTAMKTMSSLLSLLLHAIVRAWFCSIILDLGRVAAVVVVVVVVSSCMIMLLGTLPMDHVDGTQRYRVDAITVTTTMGTSIVSMDVATFMLVLLCVL
jgi:hypothetical protein